MTRLLTVRVLVVIERQGPVSITDIAKALGEEHTKVGVTVRRNVAAGLLSTSGKRPIRYALTSEGRAHLVALRRAVAA